MGPAIGADPWCSWCDSELSEADEIWMIEEYDDGRWPPAFCSEDCASQWGNAATQGNEYVADRSVIANVQ